MQSEDIVFTPEQTTLLLQLAQSRAHILSQAQAGRLDESQLRRLADEEANLTTLLIPVPVDPAEHLLAAHTYARPYLERLPWHDPRRVVVADEIHSYTPRKILRRVLDHALDHLNQIEQWLTWQQHGIVPTPTDGWATSEDTFQEDLQPLSPAELSAWLWRIDLTISVVAQRAHQLSTEQLDWTPPESVWTLRQILHHLALAEIYYVVWLDEALPDDAIARYQEANQRFEQRLRKLFLSPAQKMTTLFQQGNYATVTAEQLAQNLLKKEQEVLH